MVVDANALLGLGAAAGMIVLLATVADYVLSSIGYSKIALRRNITANWLAWIPVVRYWTIGAISDNYDSRKDIKRRIRVFLVVTQVLNAAIIIPLSISFFDRKLFSLSVIRESSPLAITLHFPHFAFPPHGLSIDKQAESIVPLSACIYFPLIANSINNFPQTNLPCQKTR